MTTGPGDPGAADAAARGHLRASHADREQVIGVLKAAFVQGRLTKGEFDLRVSQTFVSRTYGELAALTADLPAGLAAAQPRPPARAGGQLPALRPGRVLTVATTIYAAVWAVAFLLPRNSEGDPQGALQLVAFATLIYLVVLVTAGGDMLDSWHVKRSGRQLPPRPGPGGHAAGGGQGGQPGNDLMLCQAHRDTRARRLLARGVGRRISRSVPTLRASAGPCT